MAIAREHVLHIARLARLRLSPDEVERMTEQLSAILDHVARLAEADVEGVDATQGEGEEAAPLRHDEPGADRLECSPAGLAPAWQDGFFTVPRLAALDTTEPDDAAPGRPGAGRVHGLSARSSHTRATARAEPIRHSDTEPER